MLLTVLWFFGLPFFISVELEDCLLLTLAERLAAVFLFLKNPLDIRVNSSDLPFWRARMYMIKKYINILLMRRLVTESSI